jgi:hypothetical protein
VPERERESCAPGKCVVAGSGGAVGVHLEVFKAESCLDVIGSKRRQCAAKGVPCMHKNHLWLLTLSHMLRVLQPPHPVNKHPARVTAKERLEFTEG